VVTEFYLAAEKRGPSEVISDERLAIGVRVARYSYIRYRGFEELYDLHVDPFQDENVAGDPAYVDVQGQLRDVLASSADCAGRGCRGPLPPELATDPARERLLTRAWWQAIDRRYGR
jgi:hypothetical protein